MSMKFFMWLQLYTTATVMAFYETQPDSLTCFVTARKGFISCQLARYPLELQLVQACDLSDERSPLLLPMPNSPILCYRV
jgi:hypothetical protein